MYFKFKVNYSSKIFNFQFDLGSPKTVLYKERLNEIFDKETINSMLSINNTSNSKFEKINLNNLSIIINEDYCYCPSDYYIVEGALNKSDTISHKEKDIPIGTIGMDFCKDKTLIIDPL